MEFYHRPVMLEECITYLNVKEDKTYVDCTLGGGGHSLEILKLLGENGHLVGIDQDEEAIKKASAKLNSIDSKAAISIVRRNFSQIKEIFNELDIKDADGILFDLGVSSHQFDEGDRGFSYRNDAILDMRMDNRVGKSAKEIVNEYDAKALTEIIRKYGEERWASRISEFIVSQRMIKPIETTYELTEIIKKAVPKGARRDGPHPSRRTFQALRIEVNNELGILEKAITDAAYLLKPEGRLLVISFHSLEDRIVKNTFKKLSNPCICPPDFPVCNCGKKPIVRIITGKPVTGSKIELDENPRARSAKLRVCERIEEE